VLQEAMKRIKKNYCLKNYKGTASSTTDEVSAGCGLLRTLHFEVGLLGCRFYRERKLNVKPNFYFRGSALTLFGLFHNQCSDITRSAISLKSNTIFLL